MHYLCHIINNMFYMNNLFLCEVIKNKNVKKTDKEFPD